MKSDDGKKKQDNKEKEERAQLEPFIIKFLNIESISIIKRESPDFLIVLDNKKIGVEVTELVRNIHKIHRKIADQVLGKEIKNAEKHIRNNFKTSESRIIIRGCNENCSSISLSVPKSADALNECFNVTQLRKHYAMQIIDKIKKAITWRNTLQFDENVILCVIEHPLAFRSYSDLKEIADCVYEVVHKEQLDYSCKVYIYNRDRGVDGNWGIIEISRENLLEFLEANYNA